MTAPVECRVEVGDEDSILLVRHQVRALARELGFGLVDQTRIVTVASELARNIRHYAGSGCAVLRERNGEAGTRGIELLFSDSGPGIDDIEQALTEGYTTGNGLGLGLSGTKRLMDEFEISSTPGQGTKVRVCKWLTRGQNRSE